MSPLDPIIAELTEARLRELRRDAACARLVTLARCCQPSTWRRALGRARVLVRRTRAARPSDCCSDCCVA